MALSPSDLEAFQQVMSGFDGRRALPAAHQLFQNMPNPFNPITTIRYDVAEGEPVMVRLRVYDVQGRLMATLVDGLREPGSYRVFWDGTNQAGRKVASGTYFFRLCTGDFSTTRKMVLLK